MNGLGQLGAAALYTEVPAGAVIRWVGGVRFTGSDTDLRNQVEGALYQTGGFSWLSIVSSDFLFSWQDPTLTIDLKPAQGFGQLADAQALIEGAIYEYTAGVNNEPAYAQTKSIDVIQWPAGYTPVPQAQVPSAPPRSSSPSLICPNGQEWNWSAFGCAPIGYVPPPSHSSAGIVDQIATYFGVTPTQGAVIGAVGVLAGLFIIKRLV